MNYVFPLWGEGRGGVIAYILFKATSNKGIKSLEILRSSIMDLSLKRSCVFL